MNNDAELYQGSNILQKRDARQCLEDYAKEIQWKSDGGTVIDIGCGDGGVTTSILKLFIPDNFKELIGCDISDKMIEYANARYATDCISFTVLDIASDLPKPFREKFDLAFSFYALHWTKQQEIALSNIYDLLARGGECLLTFLGRMPLYEVYRELARLPRWSSSMTDVERFVSPYHDCLDPETEISRIMTTVGFSNVNVTCLEKVFVYSGEEAFKKAMFATNPYKFKLEMQEEFWKDFVKVVVDMNLVDYTAHNNDGNNQFNVKLNYKTIIARGKK